MDKLILEGLKILIKEKLIDTGEGQGSFCYLIKSKKKPILLRYHKTQNKITCTCLHHSINSIIEKPFCSFVIAVKIYLFGLKLTEEEYKRYKAKCNGKKKKTNEV